MFPLIRLRLKRREDGVHVTPRQRQADGLISRRRALRRRRLAGGALAVMGILAGIWAQATGRVGTAATRMAETAEAAVIAAGVKVDSITVADRRWTGREALRDAIHIARGRSLLHLDLAAMRRRVEALGWVKSAAVYRVFPDRLHVTLTERAPFAIWQYNGELTVIDREGVVLGRARPERFAGLPLIVGEGAPDDTATLQAMLAAEPRLADRVAAAVRVGDRRWNIRFKSGVEARLPETGTIEAWHRLARIDRRHALLSRDIVHVDMRLKDRMVVRRRVVPFDLPGRGQEI